MLPPEEFARPYDQRERFTIEAELDETFASLRAKAFEHFGFAVGEPTLQYGKPALGPVAFFKDGDEAGISNRAMPRIFWGQLTLVDDEGRAVFGVHDFRSVTLADLVRASERGVIDGDPLRPYLIAEGGWGDHPPPDWPTLIHGFEVAWPYIQTVIEGTGIALTVREVWNRVADRLKRSSETASNHREWAQRKYSPFQFQALLRTRDWTSEQISVLLGCSLEEVEPVMWGLGFTLDPESGTWAENTDEASEFVRKVHLEIEIVSNTDSRQDLDALLRKRVEYLVETGENAPIPGVESTPGEASWEEPGGFTSRKRIRKLRDRFAEWLDRDN